MSQPLIANVLTRGRFKVARETVAAKIAKRFGLSAQSAALQADGSEYVLLVDETEIGVRYWGSPMPFEAFEQVGLNTDDTDSSRMVHRDHAMVTTFRQIDGHSATLRAALAVLKVASILAEEPDASGVFWAAAGTLTDVATFHEVMAPESIEDGLPISVLIRLIPYIDDSDGGLPRHGLLTIGLQRFIGRDVEILPISIPVIAIADCFIDIADTLLQNGLIFKDGDTCGISDREKIRVRYRPTGRLNCNPIIELQIENLDRQIIN